MATLPKEFPGPMSLEDQKTIALAKFGALAAVGELVDEIFRIGHSLAKKGGAQKKQLEEFQAARDTFATVVASRKNDTRLDITKLNNDIVLERQR